MVVMLLALAVPAAAEPGNPNEAGYPGACIAVNGAGNSYGTEGELQVMETPGKEAVFAACDAKVKRELAGRKR